MSEVSLKLDLLALSAGLYTKCPPCLLLVHSSGFSLDLSSHTCHIPAVPPLHARLPTCGPGNPELPWGTFQPCQHFWGMPPPTSHSSQFLYPSPLPPFTPLEPCLHS
ncbi:hypothetical protein XENOCAPTIV_027784 [Xenoophorus captivus]|uniref:Uncharacterized protein n=1 Tax=Xenoophorus captivus TaxID=1517983 RepID=A0ABV0SBV4_9TELE